MAGEQEDNDDAFSRSFDLISDAVSKDEQVTKEQLISPTPKTAEEIAAEAEQQRINAEAAAATKAEQDAAAAAAAANAGKTPEQIAEEVEAAAAAKAEADAAAAAAKAVPDPREDALLGRLAKLVEKDAAADEAARTEAERKAAATRAQADMPQLSADELAAHEKYLKDFPEVAAAEFRARRIEYAHLTKHIFSQVEGHVQARVQQVLNEIAPFLEITKGIAERTHLGDLKQAIPDYDKIPFDKVREWVEKQPGYLRVGMEHVIKQGTREEAVDLLKRFQSETGLIPPKAGATAAETAKTQADATAAAARAKVAKSLAPVDAKRGGSVAAAAPTDFDGAFADFAKLMDEETKTGRF